MNTGYHSKNLISLFVLILSLGLILRLLIILTQEVFIDEIFYTETSRVYTFASLIASNNPIKDHGILYLVFLKFLQLITLNISYLRLPNLILYILTSFSLFFFFGKLSKGIVALVPVFLLSFLPYFIYLNSYVSPYNFVVFFSILAFISISNFILYSKTKRNKIVNTVFFLIFSTLAFYSDYSVIYFYLSLIPIIFLTLKWNEKQAENIVFIGFVNLILISPGLYQLANNFHYFFSLNNQETYADQNLKVFIYKFVNIVFSNLGNNISFLVFVFFLVLLILIWLRSKEKNLTYLSYMVTSSFFIDIFFLYLFNKSFFFIFTERIFWYFYFLILIGLYLIGNVLYKYKRVFIFFLIGLIILMYFKYSQSLDNNPISGTIIHNEVLVKRLVNNNQYLGKGLIIYYDKTYNYQVLSNYYFRGFSPFEDNALTKVNEFLKDKKTYIISNSKEIKYININQGDILIFIVDDFNGDKISGAINDEIKKYENENNIRFKTYIFDLICYKKDCSFQTYN